jgi:hypothetical protein
LNGPLSSTPYSSSKSNKMQIIKKGRKQKISSIKKKKGGRIIFLYLGKSNKEYVLIFDRHLQTSIRQLPHERPPLQLFSQRLVKICGPHTQQASVLAWVPHQDLLPPNLWFQFSVISHSTQHHYSI